MWNTINRQTPSTYWSVQRVQHKQPYTKLISENEFVTQTETFSGMFYGMRRDGVLYAMCSFSHNTCERQCADRAGGDRRIRDKYSPGSHHWSNFLVLSLHIGIKSFASVWYLVDLTATPSDVIYCIAVPMPICNGWQYHYRKIVSIHNFT